MAKYQKPIINLVANDVWSAACQAQRINGTYVKEGQTSELNPDVICKSNRQITLELLEDVTQITDEDREEGLKVRAFFQALTFKILQGKELSSFDNTAMLISNRDVIESTYDVAVIASLPASYSRGVVRKSVDQRINFAHGGYVGAPGVKVSTSIEVLRSVYSQKWNTNYVTGINGDDQVLFFSYKELLEVGKTVKINGTVKAHRDNSTQLSRVKVIV